MSFNVDIFALSGDVLLAALLVFGLRITDVSLGTIRMIMIMRGQRKWAALMGFAETTIWVVAISQVITNLDSIWLILGYSGGYATGTLVGMTIEDRLALGYVRVNVISLEKGLQIVRAIREAGFGATQLLAEGQSGPVFLTEVVTPRRCMRELLDLINTTDAQSFVTVEEARQVVRGYERLIRPKRR